MSDIDTARVRARSYHMDWDATQDAIADLCGALDEARALNDEYRAESNETWTTIRVRAEAAEADADRLARDYALTMGELVETEARIADLEAALDEARAELEHVKVRRDTFLDRSEAAETRIGAALAACEVARQMSGYVQAVHLIDILSPE